MEELAARVQATAAGGERRNVALKPFAVGSLGNFPYYWQNPINLKFNAKTYAWISASLKASALPMQLSQPFTNDYIQALSALSYVLSTSDQAKLNQAQDQITEQQIALLNAWRQAFGQFPPTMAEREQPIDTILDIITKAWASPPVTLIALQQTADLYEVLNQVPASGESVLPALANYLNALNSSISLINATSMNTRYLTQALAAVQTPSLDNGGLETDDGAIQPAYQVATPLQQILDSLSSMDDLQGLSIKMSVTRSGTDECIVAIDGGTPFKVPADELLNLSCGDSTDKLENNITIGAGSTRVDVSFKGVTMVYYGPVAFSIVTGKSWYWLQPIQDALKNGDADVSGFKSSPRPQIDFTNNGSFGFLTGVAICQEPTLTITLEAPDQEEIWQRLASQPLTAICFLGRPLQASKYSVKSTSNNPTKSTSFELAPMAADPFSFSGLDSTAWVLGVQPNFPCA